MMQMIWHAGESVFRRRDFEFARQFGPNPARSHDFTPVDLSPAVRIRRELEFGAQDLRTDADLVGRTFGNYAIGRLIGKGGGGAVYRAISAADGPAGPPGTEVALKVFHPELLQDERVFQRFQRECELGIRIRHPHVVQSFEMGTEEVEGTPYHFLAMELIEGETLRETLDDLGAFPEHLIYQVAEQLLQALAAIHGESMIHRDLKPENVVITRDREVKLMDLGVARLQQEGRDITRAGEFVGSLAYAAPEQFINQDHVDPRADQYAIGVLLYEMATGTNPFDVTDLNTLLTKKLRGQVRRPKIENRDLDPFLDDVILTCLQPEADARFESCDALRLVLGDGDTGPWWQQRIESAAFPVSARALKRLRPQREGPLVGPETGLESLHHLFESAIHGKGSAAFVCGDAGVGKSRLVHDFLEELVAPDGPLIIAGRCEPDGVRAHHAFIEAARDYLGEGEAMESRLTELLPESPELVAKFTAHLLGEGDDLTPEEFTAAATRILRTLAAERTLILAIEDLHHADPQTVTLLEQLGRALSDSNFLLVVTQREDEIEEGTPLAELPSLLAQHANAETIRVEPLGRDDVEELLHALVGRPRTVRALAWPLLSSSAGNPRFLLATVAHLKQSGTLIATNGDWEPAVPIGELELPTDLRSLLAMKLEGLDEDLCEPLHAASVQGVEFDPSLLASVIGARRIRLLKRLATLERKHRLLVSVGRSSFRFASPGLQRVVYDGIPEDERRALHGATADAMVEDEEALEPARAYEWVRQMLLAGRLAEARERIPAALEHAATHHHAADAIGFLDRVHAELAPEDRRLRFDVLMLLAALQIALGRTGDQWQTLGLASEEAVALGESGAQARVRAAFAASSCRSGHYERAELDAQRGRVDAQEAGDAECQAQCVHTLGAIAFRRGEFPRSADFWREALDLQRSIGDRRGEANSLIRLGAVMPEIGEADKALATKQEALGILREIGDRRAEGAALNDVGNAFIDADRMQEALVCFEQAIRIARELGDLPAQAAALYNSARVHAIEARIDDAKETFEKALDIFRELEDPSGEAEVLDELGSAMANFGEREKAVELLESAREAAERTGEVALLARVLRHLGTVHHQAGSREDAWRHYEDALGFARTRTRSAILADMGGAAVREGQFDRATKLLEESLAGSEGGRRTLLSLCRLARAHHGAGRADDARRYADRAEEYIESDLLVAPHHGPEVYYSLGTVYSNEARGRKYVEQANSLVTARTRVIRSVIYRDHYLTMVWPNKEIFEEARRLVGG